VLKDMLLAHETDDGRLGALEGLRAAAVAGRVPPAEVVALSRTAIGQETDDGNRLLLYEMMLSAGGPEGIDAVEQIARAGGAEELQSTAEMLAMKMEPARARAFLEEMLGRELDAPTREAMYRAMALVPGEEGVDYLMERVNDPALGGEERMAGLRGLWNRPVDERLAGELEGVFESSQDGAMRKEALRMLFYGESEASGIDLREVGVQDEDPSVRAEAVMLAAMQPGQDTRAWLEERLHGDDSLDVKAAALGSMVMHAHYAGEGGGVLDHLARARRLTSDPAALAMIAEGERMVKTHDPRRVELGLAREAQFWNTVARFSTGPASRSFERQARQLERMVETLRAAGR
jgi:hypothetical protein